MATSSSITCPDGAGSDASQWATLPGVELAANLPANRRFLADFSTILVLEPLHSNFLRNTPPIRGGCSKSAPASLDEKIARFNGFPQDFQGFLYVNERDRTSMELGRLATQNLF
jgi:hypothetical protein